MNISYSQAQQNHLWFWFNVVLCWYETVRSTYAVRAHDLILQKNLMLKKYNAQVIREYCYIYILDMCLKGICWHFSKINNKITASHRSIMWICEAHISFKHAFIGVFLLGTISDAILVLLQASWSFILNGKMKVEQYYFNHKYK
jgi:hypothetical protein